MRYLIPGIIALAAPFAAVSCVQEQISTGDPTPAPEPTAQVEQAEQVEQAAQVTPFAELVEQIEQTAATLPTFDLRAKADGDANILFAVLAPEAEGKSAHKSVRTGKTGNCVMSAQENYILNTIKTKRITESVRFQKLNTARFLLV